MNKTSNPTKRSSSKRGGRTLGVRPVRLSPVKATVVVATTLLFMAVSFLPNVASAWLYIAASGLLVLMGIRNLILYAILEKRRPNYARILELERAIFAEEDQPPPPHTGSQFAVDRRLIGIEEQAARHNGVRPNKYSPNTAAQYEWNNALLDNLPTVECPHRWLDITSPNTSFVGDMWTMMDYPCLHCANSVNYSVKNEWQHCLHTHHVHSYVHSEYDYCEDCYALVYPNNKQAKKPPPPPPAPPAPWGKSGAKRVPKRPPRLDTDSLFSWSYLLLLGGSFVSLVVLLHHR